MNNIAIKAHQNFIGAIMKSTGLPIEEMQSLDMWINNRLNDYNEVSYFIRGNINFEQWLYTQYGHRNLI